MKGILKFKIIIILFLFLFSECYFDVQQAQTADVAITTQSQLYLPVVFNLYKPIIATISHYIDLNHNYLTYGTFHDMGYALGESISSPVFWGCVILQFGIPSMIGGEYRVKNYQNVYMTIASIEYYIQAFIDGFYQASPVDAYILVVAGIINQGPYFSLYYDPEGFGSEWGTMITDLSTWIEGNSYGGKAGVWGGVDLELDWGTPTAALNWKTGYLLHANRPYLYYGTCNGCPTFDNPYSPLPGEWTADDVYTMASKYNAFAAPQIYAVDGVNAEQWYYLSLTKYFQDANEPIDFMGSVTQWSACHEGNRDCQSGTPLATDNRPQAGWG